MKSSRSILSAARAGSGSSTPFTWVHPGEGIQAKAEQIIDQRLKSKRIAIKDNFLLRGTRTTCSSRMLQEFESPYTATSVKSLLSSGAAIVGKTQMDEFGMGSMTNNLPPGAPPVHNPSMSGSSDPEGETFGARSAGGSSGGSAAAVKAGQAWAALGTDTGGSVRLPASYCGLVGLKPSHGMISRYGVVSYADTLDCVGIMASEVDDAQLLFDVMSEPDPRDPSCASLEVRDRSEGVEYEARRSLKGLQDGRLDGVRIGIPIETCLEKDLTPLDLVPFIRHLQSLGATILPISIPSVRLALPAYYVLACAEASSNLARYGGGWYGGQGSEPEGQAEGFDRRQETRRWGFGQEVKKRILAGTYALTAGAFNNSYLKALQLRQRLRSDLNAIFRSSHPLDLDDTNEPPARGVDVYLHLTAIQTAPTLESTSSNSQDARGYAQDLLTVPASLGGLPCVSLPVGLGADGWPVGASLTGQWGSEAILMDIAKIGLSVYRAQ